MIADPFEFGGEIAWRPTREYVERSRLTAFINRHRLHNYDELLERSATDPDWFWPAVFEELDIQFYEPYTTLRDVSAGLAWTRWCVGGRLNIVHNCLDKWIGTPTEGRPAVHWEGEEGATRSITYGDLWLDVNRCANGLRALGIARGDRVALFMPMCPELIVALFAVMKIGGVVLPLFSGYGADAVSARLKDAEATALVTADGFWRRGQVVTMKATADAAVEAAPSVQHVIVVPRVGLDVAFTSRDCRW